VRIGRSAIPETNGLFAERILRRGTDLPYHGGAVTLACAQRRVARGTGQYIVAASEADRETDAGVFLDASPTLRPSPDAAGHPVGQRGLAIAGYINEPVARGPGPNMVMLLLHDNDVVCRALRDIAAGEECFIQYGAEYVRDYAAWTP
jgi:hypothetical protein